MATRGVMLPIQARDKTGQAFNSLNSKLTNLGKKVGSTAVAMKGFAGIMAAGMFGQAIKESLDFADKLQKLNLTLGTTPEFLSQMKFAADQSGVAFQALEKGLRKMVDTIDAGATGTKTASDAFKRLGIDVKELAKIDSVEDQFMVLAAAFAELPAGADKAAIGMEVFGSKGLELVQIMNEGADGIFGLRAEADALGATLSQDQVEAAAAANDAMDRLNTAVEGLTNTMATSMGPTIEKVANFLTDLLPAAVGMVEIAFNSAKTVVAGFFTGLIQRFRQIAGFLAPFSETAAKVESELQLVEDALWKTTKSFAGDTVRNVRETSTAWGEFLTNQTQTAAAIDETTAAINNQTAAVKKTREAVRTERATREDIAPETPEEKAEAKALIQQAEKVEDVIASAITAGSEEGAKGMARNLLDALKNTVMKGLTDMLSNSLSGLFSGGGGGGLFGGIGKLFGFDDGGVVPGPRGAPRLAMVHAGETILPTHKQRGLGGGVVVQNTVNVGAGVNRAEVEFAMRASEKRTMASVQDLMKRGRFV